MSKRSIELSHGSIGPGSPAFIAAEVGINHNGDMALARECIDAAAEAGADAVKFQNYITEDFVSDRSLTYKYISQGKEVVESQFDMFKRCELAPEQLADLKAHCEKRGVLFFSTPTSVTGIEALRGIGIELLKNGSDYLTNIDIVAAMARTGIPTIISTGMATIEEIDDAMAVYRESGGEGVVLLHCTSSYPTPADEVNLRRIPELRRRYDCPVGFSDHSEGVTAAIGAVALGACFIEKHFTLDRNLPGPDHRFSSTPDELRALVDAVRGVEANLGSEVLGPTASEAEGRVQFRLSCVAARDLPAGHVLKHDDIAFRRPGTGLPPKHRDGLLGKRTRVAMESGAEFTAESVDAS